MVAPDCAGCRAARTLADAVRRARPRLPIEFIDLADRSDAPLPVGVVGTPTYLIDDEVVSLGNPELAELLLRLDAVHDHGRRWVI